LAQQPNGTSFVLCEQTLFLPRQTVAAFSPLVDMEVRSSSSDELNALISLLDDPDRQVNRAVLDRLGELGRSAFPSLRKAQCRATGVLRAQLDTLLHELHFTDIARRWRQLMDSAEPDVETGALLLAQHRYPDLDVAALAARIDMMAEAVRARVEAAEGVGRAFVLSTYLCNELGFEGNHDHYSDPNNSYLNCVIESRRGIPVSLCTLFLLLGRRLDLPTFGVNMPAHFLVKYQDEHHEVFFDIFNGGNPILKEQCVQFLLKAGLTPKPRYFKAASAQTILIRMVCNLLALPREETRGKFLNELTHLVEPWKPKPNVH
jgi:regulator of sirC expression with transglutaminase-like and TPR domain